MPQKMCLRLLPCQPADFGDLNTALCQQHLPPTTVEYSSLLESPDQCSNLEISVAFPPPQGHHTVTPGASVPYVAEVLQFIENVFGGKVIERYDAPDGTCMHAEIMIDDCALMLGTPAEGDTAYPALLSYYVDSAEKVDALYRKALDAGAFSKVEPVDQFYGYRTASVVDMGGNGWTICAVVEQLTQEEIAERMASMSTDS